MAEVDAKGGVLAFTQPVTGVQCALLSLLSIVWLLSNSCKESGAEGKGEKVEIK